MIDLLPDAGQRQVIDGVAALLASLWPAAGQRSRQPQAEAVLLAAGEAGWFGLGLPENLGGVGMTPCEDMLMFREIGRTLAPLSLLASSLGAQVAARSGSPLAAEVLAGRMRIGLVLPLAPQAGEVLAGDLQLFEAAGADLVLAATDAGFGLWPLDALQGVRPAVAIDGSVGLQRAVASASRPVAWLPRQEHALLLDAQVLIAALLVGMAEAVRDMAVEHARSRQQFGKPIGAFQAISHYCADMAVRAETALAQALFASVAVRDRRPDATFSAAAARWMAQEAAFRNATMNIRVHGGMGFTAECAAHRYLKRAMVLGQLLGNADALRRDLLA